MKWGAWEKEGRAGAGKSQACRVGRCSVGAALAWRLQALTPTLRVVVPAPRQGRAPGQGCAGGWRPGFSGRMEAHRTGRRRVQPTPDLLCIPRPFGQSAWHAARKTPQQCAMKKRAAGAGCTWAKGCFACQPALEPGLPGLAIRWPSAVPALLWKQELLAQAVPGLEAVFACKFGWCRAGLALLVVGRVLCQCAMEKRAARADCACAGGTFCLKKCRAIRPPDSAAARPA